MTEICFGRLGIEWRVEGDDIIVPAKQLGVLAAFIPDFAPVVAMMQFNMYHSYTVDEHTIQVISQLAKIERENFRLSTEKVDLHDLLKKVVPGIQLKVEQLGGTAPPCP